VFALCYEDDDALLNRLQPHNICEYSVFTIFNLFMYNHFIWTIFRPALRQFLIDGDFFIGAALSTTLTKLALRYVAQTTDKRKQNVSISFGYYFICFIMSSCKKCTRKVGIAKNENQSKQSCRIVNE